MSFTRLKLKSLIGGGIVLYVLVGLATLALAGGAYAALRPDSPSTKTDPSLIGWWKLNGNCNDSSGNGNNFNQWGSGGTWVNGALGGALQTNNTGGCGSSNFTVGNVLKQGYESSSWTMSTWVRQDGTNSYTGDALVMGRNGDNGGIISYGNNFRFNIAGGCNTASFSSTIGKWYNLVATLNNRTESFYANGTLVGSCTFSSSASFFAYANNFWLNGQGFKADVTIDDARVYSRALSATEIKSLYSPPKLKLANGDQGLVGWWKLNGNTLDTSPYHNNGTWTGTPAYTTDRQNKVNGAASFNGTTSKAVAIGSASNLPTGTSPRSFCAWAKYNSSLGADSWILFYGNNSSGKALMLGADAAGNLYTTQFGGLNLSGTGSSNFWNDHAWHNVCVTYDGVTEKLYADGTVRASANTTWNISLNYVRIGESLSAEYWNGSISDVRIYNRALTPTEISTQYKQYNPQIKITTPTTNINSGLIDWWQMNGNANDSMPGGVNGTLTGTTLPTLTTDRTGNANRAYQLISPGSVSSITLGSVNSKIKTATSLTVSAWIKPASTSGADTGLLKFSACGGPTVMLWYRPGLFIGWRVNDAGTVGSADLDYGGSLGTSWHLVTATQTPTGRAIYLDGVLVASDSGIYWNSCVGSSSIGTGAQIGYSSGGSNFTYSIDDVRLYNRALSASEVKTLYNTYQ